MMTVPDPSACRAEAGTVIEELNEGLDFPCLGAADDCLDPYAQKLFALRDDGASQFRHGLARELGQPCDNLRDLVLEHAEQCTKVEYRCSRAR